MIGETGLWHLCWVGYTLLILSWVLLESTASGKSLLACNLFGEDISGKRNGRTERKTGKVGKPGQGWACHHCVQGGSVPLWSSEELCRMHLRIIHWMDGGKEDMSTDSVPHWPRLTHGCCLPLYVQGNTNMSIERVPLDLPLWGVREDLGQKARNRRYWKVTPVGSWCCSNGWSEERAEDTYYRT